MNKFYIIFFVLIYSCSLNSNSAFWSKSEKIASDKKVIKILFKDIQPNKREFNPKLKLNLPKIMSEISILISIMMVLLLKKYLMKNFQSIILLE